MFNYKLIYNVFGEGLWGEIVPNDTFCLLIPEAINDVWHKLNNISIKIKKTDFEQNGEFNNGYAIFCEGRNIEKIIREDGSFVKVPLFTTICSDRFWNDLLLVEINGSFAFLDGINGEIIGLSKEQENNFARPNNFYGDYAVVSEIHREYYVNDKMQQVSPDYLNASPFVEGQALVCTDTGWQVVDHDFNVLLSFPKWDGDDLFFSKILNLMVEEAEKLNVVPTSVITAGTEMEMIVWNEETKISIFMAGVIDKIATMLDLEVPAGMDIRERLVWLVSEAAKKGNYVYSISDNMLIPIELKMGVEINDENGKVVSYDQKDVAFLRERIKRDKLDE